MRCLARNPAYRPGSAAELARQLAAASPEAPTEPLPARTRGRTSAVAPVRRTTTSLRGREWLWVCVAAAVVLVALVIALVVTSGGSPRNSTPAGVQSPARGATPADEARNFSRWLVEHSR